MAFYGKGHTPIIGVHPGVSLSFIVGMVKFNTPLESIRQEIHRISRVMDLYDPSRYRNNRNYYTENNPLTPENKISPPSY